MQSGLCPLTTFRKAILFMGSYVNLLRQLRKSSQNGLVNCDQDNAPAHKSVVVIAVVRDCGFGLVDHPLYYPDFVPSDYFLFPNIKTNTLAGNQYRTDDEVISAVEDFFEDQDESFYTTGIQAL